LASSLQSSSFVELVTVDRSGPRERSSNQQQRLYYLEDFPMIRTVSTVLAASLLTLSGLSAIAAPASHHHRQVAMATADTAAPTETVTGDKKVAAKTDKQATADKQIKKDKSAKSPKMHAKAKAPMTTSESASPTPATDKTAPAQAVEKSADKK
jgi:hypothetical protein